jgi:ubiquinone/menaquinone biosynthesis C-methylase UbiE
VGLYEDQILPRCLAWGMGLRPFQRQRARCLAGLTGRVLEVGFGAGHNVQFYPAEVTELLALEPSLLARKLSKSRVDAAPMPVSFVGLDGAQIPLEDSSVDGIACSWTLCTIPDVEGALDEMRRVLRPEGTLHFIEHGRSEHQGVARWQDRLNPLQRAVVGGCNLNRQIDQLIESRFTMQSLERFEMRGPRVMTSTYLGVAKPRK